MSRNTPEGKAAHNAYMARYMAEQRLKNPKSKPDRMRAAFREIVALALEGEAGARAKALASEFVK